MRAATVLVLWALASIVAGCGGGGNGQNPPANTNPPIPGWNLEFGAFYVTPATYGAAAGQAGPWVACSAGVTSSVANVAGAATGVSVVVAGQFGAFNTPTTDTGYLLGDYIQNRNFMPPPSPFSCTINGLPDGTYDLYYYSLSASNGWTCNGAPMAALTADSSVTARDVLGAQGTNWDVFRVTVAGGGAVSIFDTTPADPNLLGGLQIVPVP